MFILEHIVSIDKQEHNKTTSFLKEVLFKIYSFETKGIL